MPEKEEQMRSPLTLYLEWYRSAPPKVQESVAFFASFLSPSKGLFLDLAELAGEAIVPTFLSSVEALASEPPREVGVVLFLGAITDSYLQGLEDRSYWDDHAEKMAWMREEALGEGQDSIAETLKGWQEQLPLHSRQMMRSADSWQELRASTLSSKACSGWLAGLIGKRM